MVTVVTVAVAVVTVAVDDVLVDDVDVNVVKVDDSVTGWLPVSAQHRTSNVAPCAVIASHRGGWPLLELPPMTQNEDAGWEELAAPLLHSPCDHT